MITQSLQLKFLDWNNFLKNLSHESKVILKEIQVSL